jgi:NADH-quinone oxidoreductase subunit H
VIDVLLLLFFVVVAGVLPLLCVPLLVWGERKGAAFFQDRTGPNRAEILGIRLGGIIHPFADVAKLLGKEDWIPERVNRFYYEVGPFLALFVSMLPFSIIPLADQLNVGGRVIEMRPVTLNVGILYVLAITSFHVYAIVLGGWGSNNTYSLIGSLRATAQTVSYEVAMGLSIIGVLMIAQTLDLGEIVRRQGGLVLGFVPRWNVFLQPLGFLLFFITVLAETNRTPFDLPEGESEIVGFHVEYSSMRFAFYFMGEYIAMVAGSAVIATLYFGGWQVPWLGTETLRANALLVARVSLGLLAAGALVAAYLFRGYGGRLAKLYADRRRREAKVLGMLSIFVAALCLIALAFLSGLRPLGAQIVVAIVQFSVLMAKTLAFGFLFIWVRWTLPRFRYDQLMGLGWKSLIPLGLVNILVTGLVLLGIDAR